MLNTLLLMVVAETLPLFTLLSQSTNLASMPNPWTKGFPRKKIPHVIFMGLEMPEMDGVQTIGMARSLNPEIYFIVLTVFDDDDKIFEAIKAGAHGYMLKDENAAALYNAVINVKENGGAPMSAAIACKTFEMLGKLQPPGTNPTQEPQLPEGLLTEREKEIPVHTINGSGAKRIASLLNISVLTIRKHIANIYQKLHVNSKAQIISMAHKRPLGIIRCTENWLIIILLKYTSCSNTASFAGG